MKGHYKHDTPLNLQCEASDIPAQEPAPAYVPRPKYHGDECDCDSCCDIRASMDIYLKARANYQLNGF